MREERGGIRALWKGNSATLVRTMPYSAITLTSFDYYCHLLVGLGVFSYGNKAKSKSRSGKGESSTASAEEANPLRRANAMERFVAGATSGATAVVVTYPLDVMRARLALQTTANSRYCGLFSSMRIMYREGGVGTFFRGMKPTLVGILPYAGTSYMVFHTAKDLAASFDISRSTSTGQPGSGGGGGGGGDNASGDSSIKVVLRNLACGVFAGLTSQSLTYPIDMVRRCVLLLFCFSFAFFIFVLLHALLIQSIQLGM